MRTERLLLVSAIILGGSGAVVLGAAQPDVDYQTVVAGGHSNLFLEKRGWGYGWIENNVVVESFASSSDVWVNAARPNLINWSVSMRLSGSFIPADGTITPTMSAIESLGGLQISKLYRQTNLARREGGDGGYVRYEPTLTLDLFGFGDLETESGSSPWGTGSVNLTITNGWVNHSDYPSSVWNNGPVGIADRWAAEFVFSGVSVPQKIQLVPEPNLLLLVGVLVCGSYRRRKLW